MIGGGSYQAADGEVYARESPPFFSSDELDKTFVNAFERVEGPQPRITKVKGASAPTDEEEEDEEEEADESAKKAKRKTPAKKVSSSLGKDVSEQFPLAEENDLMVVSASGKFIIVEKEFPDKAVSPKLTKKSIDGWIETYLSE
jgi:hypothetical protein